MPIGNLTSQIFANIYLNELDRFVKHKIRQKYYLRYCDDFLILSSDQLKLGKIVLEIKRFLKNRLRLSLHKNKIEIRKLRQGIDFLGYVVLPGCVVLKTKTKKRMLIKVNTQNLSSYLGLLKHCKGYELERKIKCLANTE